MDELERESLALMLRVDAAWTQLALYDNRETVIFSGAIVDLGTSVGGRAGAALKIRCQDKAIAVASSAPAEPRYNLQFGVDLLSYAGELEDAGYGYLAGLMRAARPLRQTSECEVLGHQEGVL